MPTLELSEIELVCFITILIMCFIIWEGMKYQFPIDKFVENSFLSKLVYTYLKYLVL